MWSGTVSSFMQCPYWHEFKVIPEDTRWTILPWKRRKICVEAKGIPSSKEWSVLIRSIVFNIKHSLLLTPQQQPKHMSSMIWSKVIHVRVAIVFCLLVHLYPWATYEECTRVNNLSSEWDGMKFYVNILKQHDMNNNDLIFTALILL